MSVNANRLPPVVAVTLILAFTLMCSDSDASRLNLRHYDTSDGIPQIQVSSVHQDSLGYLWVATYGGVARYNGENFEVFRDDSGLSTSYINVIDSGPDGTIWVGTARGLCARIDQEFKCFNPSGQSELMVNDILIEQSGVWAAADEGLYRQVDGELVAAPRWSEFAGYGSVHALAQDDQGRVWVGGQGGLFRLEADYAVAVALPPEDPAVYSLAYHEGELWVGTGGRLFALDPAGTRVAEHDVPLPSGAQISNIEFDAGGEIWLSTPEGLVRGPVDDLELLTTREGLPNDRTLAVTQDEEGLIWVANDGGLVKILPGPFEGFSADTGLLASFVRTINEDEQQRLWLGTREGLQIVPRIDGSWDFGASTTIKREQGLPDNRIYNMAFGDSGVTWIATARGVVRWQDGLGVTDLIDRASGLPEEEVHALLIDRKGRLWISSTQGVRFREANELNTPVHPELANAFAIRIREDQAGRLWFSTLRDGLLILDPDGELTQYREAEGLTDEILWDLAPSSDGSMWVGSNGDGYFRVWPDGRIRQYTTEDGLPNGAVWQILEDDQGRVWAYTNRGLSRMDGGEFTNYTERDGLLHLEGGATGAFQSSDGLLWFASADGLMRYDETREYRNTRPPPVVLESVALDGTPVQMGDRLPFRSGSLVFRFAGLSYQDEAAVRFRYRLVGATDRWSEPNDNRRVTYANLGHGRYRFEVEAANPDGVWSEEPERFEFTVATPYWANTWFIAAAVLMVLLMIWLGVHLRLRQNEAQRRRLEHIVRQRTSELSEANRRLQRMARTDQLTGLPNRRYLFDRIREDLARSRRAHFEGAPTNGDLAFLMIDLDHFKRINDQHGHDAGDLVLLGFSRVVSEQLRDSDYLIRWGGEEFLVVACETEAERVHQIAERIIHAVRRAAFPLRENGKGRVSVTCSAGIACYPFSKPVDALDWEEVLKLADVAVYQAKALGRDRWVQLWPGDKLDLDAHADFVRQAKSRCDELIADGVLRRTESA